MKTIRFLNVGRSKLAFAEIAPFATCDVIARLATKHGRLLSHGVEAIYSETGDGSGVILAGGRAVGEFKVFD